MYLEKDLSALRNQILSKTNLTEIHSKDCSTLSVILFMETNEYVSETTIKRLFGFTPVINDFSPFILNAFSHFLGCVDWDAFKKKHCSFEKESIKRISR